MNNKGNDIINHYKFGNNLLGFTHKEIDIKQLVLCHMDRILVLSDFRKNKSHGLSLLLKTKKYRLYGNL